MIASNRVHRSNRLAVLRFPLWALAAICAGLLASAAWARAESADFDPFEVHSVAPASAEIDPFEQSYPSTVDQCLPQRTTDHGPRTSHTDAVPAAYQQSAAQPEPLPEGKPDPDAPEARIPLKPLCELTTNITLPGGMLPRDYAYERPLWVPECFDPCARTRFWPVTAFDWAPSCLTHNPLYFEEVNLERYGYGCGCYGPYCSTCVQSAVSGAHFFATVPALPYMMATDCPTDCIYTLGHYRPGSCPPWRYTCNTRPSWAGGLATAGVATGIVFLIP